ncbi:MAG TPA: hypothetical protein VGQ12_08500 [Candidatus Angelobacter sp.]|nr:hypothetical protein [Candidatus Angelobacter sp.]
MKKGIAVTATLVLVAGITYLVKKKYTKKKEPTFSAQSSSGRVNYNVAPDCVTVEDPRYDTLYGSDPSDDCGPLACARHTLAVSKHLTDDQIPTSKDNDSAIGNLESCLRQHVGGTTLIVGHGMQGKIDTALGTALYDDWYLSANNHQSWASAFSRLKQYKSPEITLWGCSTGSESKGTDLLRDIKNDLCPGSNVCASSIKSPKVPVFCDDSGLYFMDGEQWNYGNGGSAPDGTLTRVTPSAGEPMRAESSGTQDQALSEEYSAKQFSKILWEQNGEEFHRLTSLEEKNSFLTEIDFSHKIETTGCPVSRKIGTAELHPWNGNRRFFVMYANGFVRDLSRTDMKVYYQASDALINTWMNLLLPH